MEREGKNMKYRKKPVVIDAFKWTSDVNQTEDPTWIVEAIKDGRIYFEGQGNENVLMRIETLEGVMAANRGDFIIRGVKGEIYPCKPDIFKATYEEADKPSLLVKMKPSDIDEVIEKFSRKLEEALKEVTQ